MKVDCVPGFIFDRGRIFYGLICTIIWDLLHLRKHIDTVAGNDAIDTQTAARLSVETIQNLSF